MYNIQWHNKRCNESRKAIFKSSDFINLRSFINIPQSCKKGLFKCKITYNSTIQSVEFTPYQIRTIRQVSLINVIETDYNHKFLNRETLRKYREKYSDFDEIIMVKNGLVTDSYYYNIVLEKDGILTTPMAPILKGVQRQKLLDKKLLTPIDINPQALYEADCIYLINALSPIGSIKLDSSAICEKLT